MAAIPVSQPCTNGIPHADIQSPGGFDIRRHSDRGPDVSGDRKSFVTTGGSRNKSFFLASDKFHNASLGVFEDTALETGSGAEAGKIVKLVESGIGFHRPQTLPKSINLNVTSFKKAIIVVK